MSDIEAARDWANERCAALSRGSNLTPGQPGPVYFALKNTLEIERVLGAHGYPIGYRVSDTTANYLYSRSLECPDTYDLAAQILLENLGEGLEMPRMLRAFGCLVITGSLRRPKQRGRKRSDYWHRDYHILLLLDEIVEFNIPPTRNDETDRPTSACDLVASGFKQAGEHALTYKALKTIWHNAELRRELRIIRHGVAPV